MRTTSQYINDNFAICLDGADNKYNFDIHINDWIVYPHDSYIDFGIRIHNITNANSFYMYVPYKIDIEEVQELAPLFSNEKIARAMTNTHANITTSTTSPIIEISYYGFAESIIFLPIHNPSIRACAHGTLIQFSLNNAHSYINTKNGYIRFRIPHKSINTIFSSKKHDYNSVLIVLLLLINISIQLKLMHLDHCH